MDDYKKSGYIDNIYLVIRDVLKNWFSIACISISAVFIAYIIISMIYTPMYTSNCTMVVSAKENSTGAYSNITETIKLTDTIKSIMDSSVLKKKSAEHASYDSFDATLNINILENTNLLEISVTSDNSMKSFSLLSSLIEVYPELSKEVLGDVVIQIFEAPNFPSQPSNTLNYIHLLGLVFFFVTLILIAIISLHSYYYDNIKNEWEAADNLDSKLLGVIYHESHYKKKRDLLLRKKKRLLISSSNVSFGFSETIKKIRTNTLYFQEKHGGNTILVTSYKSKEGKSLVAANLACSLVQQGKSVLFILDGASSDYSLSLLNITLDEYFIYNEKHSIDDLIYNKSDSLLSILTNPTGNTFSTDGDAYNSIEKFSEFLSEFKSLYDYVIVDSPCAKHSANVEHFAKYCDFSILVVKQNGSKVSRLNDTIDMLNKYNHGVCGVVFNNVYTSVSIINAGYGAYSSYNKYGKYSRYSRYERYKRYHSYGKYGSYYYNYQDNDKRKPKHRKKRGD